MYADISCTNRLFTDDDVRELLFKSVARGIRGISALPCFIPQLKDFVYDGMDLACVVDYPYGSSDTSVRAHAALTAIRKGANTLDVVVNNTLFFNKKTAKLYEDIEAILALCKEHNVRLRAMLEYRMFEAKDIIEMANKLREIGIEYIIPATGSQLDHWDDNLVMSVEITNKANINVITNGYIVSPKQYASVLGAGVFGARFSSLQGLENAGFGV